MAGDNDGEAKDEVSLLREESIHNEDEGTTIEGVRKVGIPRRTFSDLLNGQQTRRATGTIS